MLSIFAFALGAIVGSFLNVVIHRFPREESIVFPGSHCPHCNKPIGWYDNIPILSYAILGAKCRNCKAPISSRYPLVELATGLFFLALFLQTGETVGFLLLAPIVAMTVALIYIDAEIQILPDAIDLPGIVIGLGVGALKLGASYTNLTLANTIVDSLLGALFGASVLVAIIGIYWLVRRVEGMGQGDVKMLAMIGATLGWRAIPAVLLLASVTGALIGVPIALRSGRGMQFALPFGVFLGVAFLAVLFFGPTLSSWYLSLLLR